jgi:hypothetical protein
MKIIKIGILIMAFVFTGSYVLGYIYANDTDPIFQGPERGSISDLLVNGAVGFIDSNCEALLLLREYEISSNAPFSIANALLRTENALNKLEESRKSFSDALKLGETCGYVKTYRDMLIAFDYDAYIREEKLNSEIANSVACYLKKGDVLGMYRKNIDNIDELIETLKNIQSILRNNAKPDISIFWRLLQKYSISKLYGNYMTVLSIRAFQED